MNYASTKNFFNSHAMDHSFFNDRLFDSGYNSRAEIDQLVCITLSAAGGFWYFLRAIY